jgi:Sulfotransferase domain
MKVIGAGFGRTGTLSLKAALEQLGVEPCYHMVEVLWGDTSRLPAWQAAAEGERVDWRALLEGFQGTVDWPGCTFYEQLMHEFPDAKVLLTLRDPDAWYESVKSSIYAALLAGRNGELGGGSETPPTPEAFGMIGTLIWQGTFDGRFEDRDYAIEVFNRHNDEVRRRVPADRLTVHEIKDGWEPLARMLNVPEPETPFPRLNDKASFAEMIGLPSASS